MRVRLAIFGALGAVGTVLGAVLILSPDLVLGIGPVGQAVTSLSADPKSVMATAAAVIGAYVLATARSPGATEFRRMDSAAEQRFDAAETEPPEAATVDQGSTTGAGVDADVRAGIESGGRSLQTLRESLRELAADSYAARDDWEQSSRADARHAVDTGSWTDDPVAAAFLSGDDGPTPSLLSRLRLWLAPERERERRIESTVAAIEGLREDR